MGGLRLQSLRLPGAEGHDLRRTVLCFRSTPVTGPSSHHAPGRLKVRCLADIAVFRLASQKLGPRVGSDSLFFRV